MTKHIRNVINTPYIGKETYSNLLSLLNNATADISFWGTRYITAKPSVGKTTYEGSCAIDDLKDRVNRLVKENIKFFSKEERQIGLQLVDKINDLDYDSEKKRSEKWWWTRIFVFLREELFYSSRLSRYFNGDLALYTKEQYIEAFGKAPKGPAFHQSPERWKYEM